MKSYVTILAASAAFLATSVCANLLTNPDFSLGDGGKEGWIGYVNVFDTSGTTHKYGFESGTEQAVVNNSVVTFSTHPGWLDNGQGPLDLNDKIEVNFYQDFGDMPAFAGEEVIFSGNFSVATPYEGEGTGIAFIKILDTSWAMTGFITADVQMSDGSFSLVSMVPVGGINSFQVGFANFAHAGDAGAMEFSNLSLIPEPSHYAALLGLAGLALVLLRRRRG